MPAPGKKRKRPTISVTCPATPLHSLNLKRNYFIFSPSPKAVESVRYPNIIDNCYEEMLNIIGQIIN